MFTDDDLVIISAISQYAYCPRRCALIHVESIWEDNVFTLRGLHDHERMDAAGVDVRDGLRIERALPVWSDRLGLIGRTDVVEFDRAGTPYPVEAKPSKTRHQRCHDLQLCAQAICLEEMMGLAVPSGAISYLGSKRRREVEFTAELRAEVERVTEAIRALIRQGVTPPPVDDWRCESCSLADACVPEVLAGARAARMGRDLYLPPSDEEDS
ncbi:MAG: CRISPR-associated protein Cas4 [Armatimonadetes bacterium]|nr:CRISPR-associated protein Cas4 [Armatimonadota bacterium]